MNQKELADLEDPNNSQLFSRDEIDVDDETKRLIDQQDAKLKITVFNTEFNTDMLNQLSIERSDSMDKDTQTDPTIDDHLDNIGGFGRF